MSVNLSSAQLPSKSSRTKRTEDASTIQNTPTNLPTVSFKSENPTMENTVAPPRAQRDLARTDTELSITESQSTESLQAPPPEPISTQSGVTRSMATSEVAKSRRRQGVSLPSTPPSTEETSLHPSASTQSAPADLTPLLSPTTEKPAPEKSTSVLLRPTQSNPTKFNAEKPEFNAEKPETGISLTVENPVPGENMDSRIEVQGGKTLVRQNVKIHDKFVAAAAQGNNSTIKIMGGEVSAEFIALSASDGATLNATDITVKAKSVGLLTTNGTIDLKNSTVNVTGASKTHGIVFRGTQDILMKPYAPDDDDERENPALEKIASNKVTLTNTKILAPSGIGIGVYGTHASGEINLKNSQIHAGILAKNEKEAGTLPHTLIVTADSSFLEGRVITLQENKTVFNLENNAKWFLKANKNIMMNDENSSEPALFGVDEKSHSNLSALNLTESAIVFDKPTEGNYQTLFVGFPLQQEGKMPSATVVYSAKGTAEIHLNSQWSSHSPVTEQETDRIVINGDVSGTSIVYINLAEKNKEVTNSSSVWKEHMASLPSTTQGISIIQVSGKADKNAFKLAKGYMTMGGSPYKYELTAYAPGASHASQNLFGKNDDNFWDFRLQNAYLDKDKKIRALLPQVANYLVMPSAVFSAGFTDVNNQNTLLDNIQATVFGTEDNKKKSIFLSSYGEKVTFSSNRDPLHYGYDADVNYGALQLGVVLVAREGKEISTHFGLLGTYGKLAFTPKDIEDSEKTLLDKWSLTAYSGIQHRNGLHVNTLLSYGSLKGTLTTALIGSAAKLDGTETFSASATIGQKLTTGVNGLIFEPQAQFVYQKLMFDVLSDADGFEVNMNNPHQWLFRIGGQLTQTLTTAEEGNAVSFYGKLNMIRTFGDGETIKIADIFHRDPTGSFLEGGIGVNAHLSQSIALHGDLNYRQKLQKGGVSGTSFSGGIRYRF